LLITLPAHGPHFASVRQRDDEDHNISLMYVGLIAGTPIFPKLGFSIGLLSLFCHLRRRQPSVGIQGFVKAVCAFQQVHFLSFVLYSNDNQASLNMSSRWIGFFHKLSMSFPMCNAGYKTGWMWHLAAILLLGG